MPDNKTIKRKIAGIYSLATGLLGIFACLSIIFLDLMPEAEHSFIAFIFKWFSLIITAAMLTIAGFTLIQRLPMRRALFFIAGGFLISSSHGLLWQYLMNFAPAPFLISLLLILSAVIIIGWNYRNWKDLVFIALAISTNSSINLIGRGFQKNAYHSLSFSSLIFVFSLLAIVIFYQVIYIRENIENKKDSN